MEMHSYVTSPSGYKARAALLVREVLMAFVAEAKSFDHPIVDAFGIGEVEFNFIKHATTAQLLRLAEMYVRSDSIQICLSPSAFSLGVSNPQDHNINEGFSSASSSLTERLFCHRQIARELVLLLADGVSILGEMSDGLPRYISPSVKRELSGISLGELEEFACRIIEEKRLQIRFNKNVLIDRTKAVIRHERREALKDLFVSKKATCDMISFLFSEENENTLKARRARLGVEPVRGRPKSARMEIYTDFILLWTENQQCTDLERFLLAHRKLNCSFDVLWTLYQRALEAGEFSEDILSAVRKNLACQTAQRMRC
ncbi:TPA: hypothetical protein QDZ84_003433 [Shewanella algae]|uniref:hypothetical protein n=1 Tax=Shewanella TaxID=22 RepID=UPI0014316CB5|nr:MULTISPECIES: hypothetical protein [Shewanella]NJI86979.1 hypothetical protein [Shewanella sp. Iso12]HDS1208394.1 hypothetical protein [Shewanella algae]